MSSVASSSITSTTSSTVIRPSSRPSPSTTGSEIRSYFLNIVATRSWSRSARTEMTCGSMTVSTRSSGCARMNLRSGSTPIRWCRALTMKTVCRSGTSSLRLRIISMAWSMRVPCGTATYSTCMIPPAVSSGYRRSWDTSADTSRGTSSSTARARRADSEASRSVASSESSASTRSPSRSSDRRATNSSWVCGVTRLRTSAARSTARKPNTLCLRSGSSRTFSSSAVSAGCSRATLARTTASWPSSA